MALTDQEKAMLADLQRREAEPNADDDYEIEIFSGDKGARIPFSQGKAWLYKEFGIGEPPAPLAGDGQDGGGQDGQGGKPPAKQRAGAGAFFTGKK